MTTTQRGHLEDRYFERMAQATAEKTALIPHLVPGTVADVGAGGGQLALRMSQDPRIEHVWAIDNAIDSVRRLNDFTSFSTLYGSTGRLACIAPVDNVVFSSVLHEIYSYAGPYGPRRLAWRQAVKHAIKALSPGGRLIIRDFVKPADPDEYAMLATPGDHGDAMLYEYLERTPFDRLRVLDELDEHLFIGTRRSVVEALLTVNWGPDSLPRESQERYGLGTLDGYADDVLGLSDEILLVHSSAEVQPGYPEHLADWRCLDLNGTAWFPDTKALWVFEKRAEAGL